MTVPSCGGNMKSEHTIQSEIMLALSKHDCTVIRTNAGQVKTEDGRRIMLAPKGWPDLTAVEHQTGRMVLIEVKNEKGILRPEQKKFAANIQQYPKIIYGVARSAEQAIQIVEEGLKR